MINVKVSIDRLIVTPLTNRLIVSDSVGFVYADFIFDDEWQGLTKTATFSAGDEAYDVLLNGDRCEIPHELLKDGAEIRIAVKGYAEDVIVITKAMNSAIKVWAAGIHEGTQPGAYTPELWEQVLQNLESKQNTLVAGQNITLEEQTDGTVRISATGGGGGSSEAVDIHIEDEEDYYTSDNVEGALSEIGENIYELGADVQGLITTVNNKQDKINDISEIRVNAQIGKAVNDVHVPDNVRHITAAERETWNGKQDAITDIDEIRSGAEKGNTAYQKPTNGIPASDIASGVIPTVPTALSQLTGDTSHRTVTDAEKTTWNGKQNAITAGVDYATPQSVTAVDNKVSAIDGKISASATSTNKLVSASEMGDAISSVEAKQIYKTASQGSFATKSELTSATVFYNADGSTATPTKNDVAYVLADESHDNKLAKYVVASVNPTVWGFVISISQTSFTQAQNDAINSGITSTKRSGYDTHVSNGDIHVTTTDKSTWNGKYTKPSSGIPKTDLASAVQTSLGKADSSYQKPSSGIPASDLASGVIPSVPTQLSQLTADATHRTVTDTEKSTWNGKQNAISDLATIRSGAAAGATALQSVPSTYRTASAQDTIDAGKQNIGRLTVGGVEYTIRTSTTDAGEAGYITLVVES